MSTLKDYKYGWNKYIEPLGMESHIDKNITKSHVQEFIKGKVTI